MYYAKDAKAYDDGKFGSIPLVTFKSTNLASYNLLRRSGDDVHCAKQDTYIFLGGSNKVNKNSLSVIIDGHGDVVYARPREESLVDFRVQYYRGKAYLTGMQTSGGSDQRGSFLMVEFHGSFHFGSRDATDACAVRRPLSTIQEHHSTWGLRLGPP